MENYISTNARPYEIVSESAYAKLMRNVYLWMALALVVTGMSAYYVAHSPAIQQVIFSNQIVFWGLIIGELALVFALNAMINRISFTTAGLMFIGYSLMNGVLLSSIFVVYTDESIASVFLITAGTFGAMAVVGSFIKKDLSAVGRIFIMALIGIIIATVVNMFLRSDGLTMILNYLGVLVFVGLTAYDAQKIKMMLQGHGTSVNESTMKIALLGSLSLYLDFINLFLYLLRIFGARRD
ncbi:MAG: Bax inhibitor-1/YccA family protein [Bacteroidaceae bacterium]|nr:Bax inhibitor-1/YccA family protein [Bacteroidaceae bacterium]